MSNATLCRILSSLVIVGLGRQQHCQRRWLEAEKSWWMISD